MIVFTIYIVEVPRFGRRNTMLIYSVAAVALTPFFLIGNLYLNYVLVVLFLPVVESLIVTLFAFTAELYETELRVLGLGHCDGSSKFFSGFMVYFTLFLFN